MQREQRKRLALPGDADLDFDVSGLVVTAVVPTAEQELLVRLAGGRGRFGGDPDPVSNVSSDVRAYFFGTPAEMFAAFVTRLQRWRDTRAPIRMCAAPDRLMVLIDNEGHFLPIPRHTHPDWVRGGQP